MPYFYLATAILFEVIGTSALKVTDGFSKLAPTIVVFAAYAVSFYLLALAIRSIDVAIAYAVWSAAGIVLIAIIGVVYFRQALDVPAIIGLAMILGGVLIIFLWSKSALH